MNIFAFRNDLNLGALIRALQNRNLLQILAEPNLVTTNGKEASFLVGGEFPIPVLQGGANSGAVTIQFREFGIRLNFNPTVTGEQYHSAVRAARRCRRSISPIRCRLTVSLFPRFRRARWKPISSSARDKVS